MPKLDRRKKSRNRRARFETLEQRQLLAADAFGTNPLQPLDVSRDGQVSALDALRVLNALSRSKGSGFADPASSIGTFIDVTGDGQGTALDALRVINAIGRDQTLLAATISNDTGSPRSIEQTLDLITSDYGFSLHVAIGSLAGSSIALQVGELGEPNSVTDRFASGRADFTAEDIDNLLGVPLRDGTHPVRVFLNEAEVLSFPLTVDRSSPLVEINSIPESAAANPSIRLVGRVVDAHPFGLGSVSVATGSKPLAFTQDGNFDEAIGDLVALGDNLIAATFTDAAGNVTEVNRNIDVVETFVDGADEASGWIAQSDEQIVFGGRDSFVLQADKIVNRSVGEPERFEFTVEFAEEFSSQSSLLVYLLDPNDASSSIVADDQDGPFFRLNSDGTANYPAGRVRFDGSKVSLDLSDIDLPQGLLRFQRIGHTASDAGLIRISNFENVLLETPPLDSSFSRPTSDASIGPSVDLDAYSSSDTLDVQLNARQFDDPSGNYTLDVSLHADTDTSRRPVLVHFPDLPANVSLVTASGFDGDGHPYINLSDAMPAAGLMAGQATPEIQIEFTNPAWVQFALTAEVLVGPENRAPILPTFQDLTLTPGEVVELDLRGDDPDGDHLTYQIAAVEPGTLPAGQFSSSGTYRLSPLPGDEGSYGIDVIVSDGQFRTTGRLSVEVVADAETSTRVSGQILDVDGSAITGMQVELGQVSALTDATGRFTLDLGEGPLLSDTLKVRGELFAGPHTYPFIAEKLPLVLERAALEGINNVISRPIFLPKVDVANGQTIDPLSDTTVGTPAVPGATVQIAAGTLVNQQGTAFDGVLSITEVPVDLTPAALPSNLLPDLVLTIQPGEMVFTTPAPMTFPNRAGFEPGTVMNLWSINPVTGDFDDVGDMQVSADGETITTIEGGVRNSSWHFVAPLPEPELDPPQDEPENQDQGCPSGGGGGGGCDGEAAVTSNSEVELHSGALREMHSLPAYSSLGVSRSLGLHYNSQYADPRPIIHFGVDNARPGSTQQLAGSLLVKRGNQVARIDGTVPGQLHSFVIPPAGGDLSVAIQGDMTGLSSGTYTYELSQGLVRLNSGRFVGALSSYEGQLVHVNHRQSPFGAGWALGETQHLIENPDGSLLLIYGAGNTLAFGPDDSTGVFESMPGDFSQMQRDGNGYVRTMPNQMVYRFDANGRLVSSRDRNGNTTAHVYVEDRLTEIVDPVGLRTQFEYDSNGHIVRITDPAGRVTKLNHDDLGNLTRITDPDGSNRQFRYDNEHRLIGETDKRGNTEQTFYGFHGRVERSIRKDGTEMFFDPLQTRVLMPPTTTLDPLSTRTARFDSGTAVARVADSNGNVTETLLDQAGQAISALDGGGDSTAIGRNANNQIVRSTSPRGNVTHIGYDDRGNVTSVSDSVSLGRSVDTWFVDTTPLPTDGRINSIDSADFNGDGTTDVVVSVDNRNARRFEVFLGGGDGTFRSTFTQPALPGAVAAGDATGDGIPDILIGDEPIRLLVGRGDGTFEDGPEFASIGSLQSGTIVDVTQDGMPDLVLVAGNKIHVAERIGEGQFAAPSVVVDLPVGRRLDAGVIAKDLNDDGLKDLIVSGEYGSGGGFGQQGSAYVAIAQDERTFAPVVEYQLALGRSYVVSSLKVEDLDADGNLDLAAQVVFDVGTRQGNGVFVVRFGLGDGTFDAPVVTPFDGDSSRFAELAILDVNGDERLDAVYTQSATDESFAVLIQQPDRTFVRQFQPDIRISGRSEASDFNGDGRVDLLIASELLLGQEDGSFAANDVIPIDRPASFGDFNQDGILDAVWVIPGNSRTFGRLMLSLSQPDGSRQAGAIGESVPRSGVAVVGDFNGDGFDDFLDTLHQETHFGDGTGNFQIVDTEALIPVTTVDPWVNVADFNGDSFDDVISIRNSEIFVHLSDGDGTFTESETKATYNWRETYDFHLADVNLDGNSDLLLGQFQNGVVETYLGDGNGGLIRHDSVQAFSFPTSSFRLYGITAGNFDGDANVEVVAVDTARSGMPARLRLWDVDSDGRFIDESVVELELPVGVDRLRPMVAADFNGDGIDDLYLDGGRGGVLLPGSGTDAAFLQGASYSSQPFTNLAAYDADDDGDLDLIGLTNSEILITENVVGMQNSQSVRYEYDPNFNQLTSYSDGVGRQTLYEIDPSNGNTLSEIRVVGELDSAENGETDDVITRYRYMSQGLVDTITDPLGRVTDYDYDDAGRVVAVTYAVGTADEATERFEYDPTTAAGLAGMVTAMTDERNHRTEYQYDALNRVTRIIEADPDGAGPLSSPITLFEYDAGGNLVSTTDARGNVSRNEYDPLDRMTASVDALQNTTTYQYDLNGNQTAIINPLGHITESVFDSRDRLIRTIDAEGGVTEFGYDSENNVIRLVDPVGNATRFRYDQRNRQIEEIDPLGNRIRYRYDGADQLTRETDRNDRVTEFIYDDLSRLVREGWIRADGSLANQVSYDYDPVGNLLTAVDEVSSLTYTYDDRDRMLTEDNFGTPEAPHSILTYTYDASGNVTSVRDVIDGQTGATTSYQYDALDRNTRITQAGAEISEKRVDFVYNELGQFETISRFSDLAGTQPVVATDYQYDGANRLIDLRHSNQSEVDLAFFEYGYDGASRITAINSVDGLAEYRYDRIEQLTVADYGDATRTDESFAYDDNGNRVQSHLHGESYVTGPANRIIHDGKYDYTYDAEGNLIRRTDIETGNQRTFQWDHRNRLTRVDDFTDSDTSSRSIHWRYDIWGRRTAKSIEEQDQAVQQESYVYDRGQVILDVVEASPTDSAGLASQTRYVSADRIDFILAQETAGATQWLLSDHLGSVTDSVSDAGELLGHRSYDAFGQISDATSASIDTRFGYSGREFDEDLSLTYHRARYVDNQLGVFLSEDPSRFRPLLWNLRYYVANSPLAYTDPTGRIPTRPGVGAPIRTPPRHSGGSGVPVCSSEQTLESRTDWLLGDETSGEGEQIREERTNSDADTEGSGAAG